MLQVTHLRRYPGPRMVTQLIKAPTTLFSVKTVQLLPLTMFEEMTLEFMYAMQRTTSTLFLRLLILMCNVSTKSHSNLFSIPLTVRNVSSLIEGKIHSILEKSNFDLILAFLPRKQASIYYRAILLIK